ncbi:unnamed protein product [Vicia faba]|uniref:Uncharacterized protein n=1 Tax=Vicia faba TaxID=3906 RepID=A0AAV0ZE72_VICFA|nr:unnamed protein product [Vicia faba]
MPYTDSSIPLQPRPMVPNKDTVVYVYGSLAWKDQMVEWKKWQSDKLQVVKHEEDGKDGSFGDDLLTLMYQWSMWYSTVAVTFVPSYISTEWWSIFSPTLLVCYWSLWKLEIFMCCDVRAINKLGSQLLGANGRDDGVFITSKIKEGINKISLISCDTHVFCFGVRIIKMRSVQ